MNWKKWIKYAALLFGVLLITSTIYMGRQGKRIYGGLTQKVDHEQFQPQEGTFAITDVSVLSADGEHLIHNQTVIIKDGMISAVDSAANIPHDAKVIKGMGKFLIPGLIDTHVHLFKSPNDLLLYIANGVTEVRELIGETDHLKWKKEIENGRIGPRMFVASPRIGSFEPMEGRMMTFTQGYLNITNAEEAREKIRELHEQGYDGIKIYSQINKESYIAITETAKELSMPVIGHIPWELEFIDIFKYGQSGIGHFEELMNALSREFSETRNIGSFGGREEEFLSFVETRSDELAANLIKSDIAVTSTLWLTESFAKQPFDLNAVLREVELDYENPGISEWVSYIPQGLGWLPEVNRYKLPEGLTPEQKVGSKKYWDTYAKACQLLAKNMAERGVKIMTGTDANLPPTVPGFSLHDELNSLNRAGMSTVEVLKSATTIPATWLKSNAGKIAPGFEANLVLLDKNPLEDIRNTKSINSVISKGKVFDRGLLDEMLAAVKASNDASRKVNIDQYRRVDN